MPPCQRCFSTMTVISFFLSPFTGRIADRHGPRRVVACGAVLMCAGLVATAHVPSFLLLFLTYGVGLGGAVACIYIPAIAAVGEWFNVSRVLALGVAVSGIGCGTLLAAPVSAMLIERYGWWPAIEILGWVGGVLIVVSALLLFRPPVPKKRQKSLSSQAANTDFHPALCLLLPGRRGLRGSCLIPAYAMDLGATRVAAASLVGYIRASSVVGRLGGSMLAPFWSFQHVQACFRDSLCELLPLDYRSCLSDARDLQSDHGGRLWRDCGMAPAVTASLFGVQGLGQLLGVLFTALGLACLVGPPVAGLVIDYSHTFHGVPFYAAAAAALSVIVAIPLHRLEPEAVAVGGKPVAIFHTHHW